MKLDTIDNLVVDGQEPVSTSIDDLNTSTMSTVTQKPLPQSATDNQSAVLSAISGDGKNVVENYTRMQNETAMGIQHLKILPFNMLKSLLELLLLRMVFYQFCMIP